MKKRFAVRLEHVFLLKDVSTKQFLVDAKIKKLEAYKHHSKTLATGNLWVFDNVDPDIATFFVKRAFREAGLPLTVTFVGE